MEIIKKQNGASVKFKISFIRASHEEIIKEHNIHNFVIVRFKSFKYNGKNGILIAMKKHENTIDWTFTVDVSSNVLNFSKCKNICCPEDWSDWYNAGDYTDQWLGVIDIKMNIIKKHSIVMHKIHEDDTFADFELSADDGRVSVLRAYLAAHSDVFKTMLNGQWKETAQGRVELPRVTRQTLQHFKDFMYLGSLPDDGLCPLLLFATRYLVEDLKPECMMKVIQTITPENLNSHIEFAVENEMKELIDTIFEYIPNSFFATAMLRSLEGKIQSSSSSDEK